MQITKAHIFSSLTQFNRIISITVMHKDPDKYKMAKS